MVGFRTPFYTAYSSETATHDLKMIDVSDRIFWIRDVNYLYIIVGNRLKPVPCLILLAQKIIPPGAGRT